MRLIYIEERGPEDFFVYLEGHRDTVSASGTSRAEAIGNLWINYAYRILMINIRTIRTEEAKGTRGIHVNQPYCPDCGGDLIQVGHFQKGDRRQWVKVCMFCAELPSDTAETQ